MAEMVGSAVVQEVVGGAFSLMRNNHEEMASQSYLIERLKYAHLELKFALERTKRMPIIEVSLLQRRMMLKHVFDECRDLLYKHTLEDEGAEQGVTLSQSLPNRIMHALKPFFGSEKGSISESRVRRFELFAEKTDKFVRDVESGFSLALYRFSCPLVTQLLEGKCLHYVMVSGSQTRTLGIHPCFLEDYGVVANVRFEFKDLQTPMKCFMLDLILRVSESTDIVGISTKCLQSLEPQFKPVADVASGELAQLSTQVGVFQPGPHIREFMSNFIRSFRQEPSCCIGDGSQPSANTILSTELTEKFPEQISYLSFECFISAAEHNLLSIAKAWPIVQLSISFAPHCCWNIQDDKVCTYLVISPEECYVSLCAWDLSMAAQFAPLVENIRFDPEPELTEINMLWVSAHGLAKFTVSKPPTGIGCAPPKIGEGSRTRRASKRRR